MKEEWIVQLALPWMVNDPDEPAKEQRRQEKVSRWIKPCAQALAELNLREIGNEAKVRVYNPRTGEYEAMLFIETENKEEKLKVFNGKEDRKKAA